MTSDPREWLNERLAWAYIQASGKATHTNTCSTSVAPARQPGPCDCDTEDRAESNRKWFALGPGGST